VLPDWRHSKPKAEDPSEQAKLDLDINEATMRSLSTLLNGFVTEDREQLQQQKADSKLAKGELSRTSNKELLCCLDNQLLRGCGLSLQTFIPARPLRQLALDEERYFPMLKSGAGPELRRKACVKNKVTGERWFEVPLTIKQGVRQKVWWHICLDMGTVGWAGICWYIYKCSAKATMTWDRPHRLHNDWLDGLSAAGLTVTRLEWMVVLNLRTGPFKKSAYHKVIQGGAQEMFQRVDHTNLIFRQLYDGITADLGMSHDPGFGTEEHFQDPGLQQTVYYLSGASKTIVC
jgi:hypothetical protein